MRVRAFLLALISGAIGILMACEVKWAQAVVPVYWVLVCMYWTEN